MKKISSGQVFFMKKIFPFLWVGGLALVLVPALMNGAMQHAGPVIFIVPTVMLVVGALVYRMLVWDLIDEVHDGGDFLKVRKGSEEDTIPLSNIMNVSATTHVNPPRVTLRLSTPCRFGNEVTFSPIKKFSLNPFAKNPIAEDLIVRADAARRGARR